MQEVPPNVYWLGHGSDTPPETAFWHKYGTELLGPRWRSHDGHE